jgi:hypothetical protein
MADGKNIEIKIAATGGGESAAEICKVGEATQEASENTNNLDDAMGKVARAQQAMAVVKLAEDAGKLAGRFREAADSVEDFDKDAAVALRDTARHIDDVSNSISSVAAGFAAGGPLGAALASLGVMIKALSDKWQESEIVALKAAANEKAATEETETAFRNATTAAQERATALKDATVLAAMDAELKKAKDITAELQRQTNLAREKRALESEVLDARDRSNLEKVGLDEASGKITPDQAAEKRDTIESGARKRDREERKRRALEDAVTAGDDAVGKTDASDSLPASAAARIV